MTVRLGDVVSHLESDPASEVPRMRATSRPRSGSGIDFKDFGPPPDDGLSAGIRAMPPITDFCKRYGRPRIRLAPRSTGVSDVLAELLALIFDDRT